jgi:predicted enzyme related to lactoylglutathione lyase
MRQKLFLMFVALTMMANANAQETGIEKLGMYVIAADVNKSRQFYERLFQKPPYFVNDTFAGFDIAGGLYAVFAASAADRKIDKGNSAVPYIRVKDAELEFERIKSLNVTMLDSKVLHEGPVKLFRIADPDGNVVEFFSVVPATK